MNTVNQVGIYNMALAAVGVSRFIQSTADTSVQAQTCNVFWESVRDQCLSDYPWVFAARFAHLQRIEKCTPGWRHTYAYPADCLAARELVRRDHTDSDDLIGLGFVGTFTASHRRMMEMCGPIAFATVENEAGGGLAIATNEHHATLSYTARVTTYTLWSPAFVNCLTLLLASKIVGPLANNPKYATELGRAYEVALLKAGASSMNEQQERPEPESELVTVRG